jgi:hypothetical protein
MLKGSYSFIRDGSGLREEASPIFKEPLSSKKIEDLQELQAISFVHLK